MRAANIFLNDLAQHSLIDEVKTVKVTLYGSLASTGKGHHTPQAIVLGLEGSDPETIDTSTINARFQGISLNKSLHLGGRHRIQFDLERDMLWRWDQVLKTHPNGMRFSCFGADGDLLATNEYFSVGGGFVVNEATKVSENLFYKGVDKRTVHEARLHHGHNVTEGQSTTQPSETSCDTTSPPFPFTSGDSLLALTRKHNMTIAQIVHENERFYGLSDEEIHSKLLQIWRTMDECIRTGVSTSETTLPGRLQLQRRAPSLYRRLMRGFYRLGVSGSSQAILPPDDEHKLIEGSSTMAYLPEVSSRPSPRHSTPRVVGLLDHSLPPMPPRKAQIPAVDFLSCYAIAVNEVNASGGRIVTSPTNGAAGVIPAVLKYIVEFITDEPEMSVSTFLLTASAVGMLFKRGSTISAAEGGCQAEVGVACSMAAAGFAACMGASPETVLQAAEIGIEHNLGLTCDPIDGLVQVPCIERNSLGAVKAVTAAQLSMASNGVYKVTLDEAIEAMRLTAQDMSHKYKETSLSGLATTVKIPLSVPAC